MSRLLPLPMMVFVCLSMLQAAPPVRCVSPSGKTAVDLQLTPAGELTYRVTFGRQVVIAPSKLGFTLADGDLSAGFEMAGQAETRTADETWKPVLGEVASIRNHYREVLVKLRHRSDKRLLHVRFRVYDDGVGFRYEFPAAGGYGGTIAVRTEHTAFRLTRDLTAFWIPGDWDSNEHRYSTTLVSEIDGTPYIAGETNIATKTLTGSHNVQTPLALRTGTGSGGYHMAIHEAALLDFPAMQLSLDPARLTFTANLTPSADTAIRARVRAPFHTPWRAILLSGNAAGLLESKLILNLNEPSKIADVSWIKPQKFVGIWWEMHVGKSTWDYAGGQNAQNAQLDGKAIPHGKHGATTENTKRYIDFAARHGFDGVLVEGWNIGWENWFGQWRDSVFSFTTPYPDYDIDALSKYAREKGVRIICHHETSSAVTNYESQMDAAYRFCKQHGMNSVKTGYVGRIIPRGEYHDGQWMVNHYARVAEKMAQYQLMVDAHESVRPTGLHRTYPNWVANEAARGNEFNGWSRGNLPEHETILPFTRLLGGPMDYTPGIFDIKFEQYKKGHQVHTTVAKQLALYVTMYSPLQMAADLPENYEGNPAFQFIKDVAADWDDTRVLQAEIGDYIGMARKAKGTPNWFVGCITDESARSMDIRLDFLEPGREYDATLYTDGPNAHWQELPTPVRIEKRVVRRGDMLRLRLAPGGGAAASLMRR